MIDHDTLSTIRSKLAMGWPPERVEIELGVSLQIITEIAQSDPYLSKFHAHETKSQKRK